MQQTHLKHWLAWLCAALLGLPAGTAQREYNAYDSTFYVLNTDTTVIAGKRHLYFLTQNTLTTIHDFTTPDSTEYIRDFDIINDNTWYTLVGSRYISGESYLYKSTDKGATWALDTSYYAMVPPLSPSAFTTYNGVNQVQELGQDTVALLIGYYSSAVMYSYNAGQTWNWWYESMHAHYGGFLVCDTTYYLWGWAGDGFSAYMFDIYKSELFTAPFTYTYCQPSPPGTYSCVRAINATSRYGAYLYFENFVDSICNNPISYTPSIAQEQEEWRIFPNPLAQGEPLHWYNNATATTDALTSYTLRNSLGQLVVQGIAHQPIHLPPLPQGYYYMTFYGDGLPVTRRLMIYR